MVPVLKIKLAQQYISLNHCIQVLQLKGFVVTSSITLMESWTRYTSYENKRQPLHLWQHYITHNRTSLQHNERWWLGGWNRTTPSPCKHRQISGLLGNELNIRDALPTHSPVLIVIRRPFQPPMSCMSLDRHSRRAINGLRASSNHPVHKSSSQRGNNEIKIKKYREISPRTSDWRKFVIICCRTANKRSAQQCRRMQEQGVAVWLWCACAYLPQHHSCTRRAVTAGGWEMEFKGANQTPDQPQQES